MRTRSPSNKSVKLDIRETAANVSPNPVDDFETWLSAQGTATDSLTPERLALWRQVFDEAVQRAASLRAQPAPSRSLPKSDRRYGVAIQDGDELGLTFWIKRSAKGEIFLFYPRE